MAPFFHGQGRPHPGVNHGGAVISEAGFSLPPPPPEAHPLQADMLVLWAVVVDLFAGMYVFAHEGNIFTEIAVLPRPLVTVITIFVRLFQAS